MDSEKVSANTMDSEKVFHMAGGDGETSYAKNSLIQVSLCHNFTHTLTH